MTKDDSEILANLSLVTKEGFVLDQENDLVLGETCQFETRYCDLPEGSRIEMELRDLEDLDESLSRSLTIDLFQTNGHLKQGKFKIPLTKSSNDTRLAYLEATLKRFEEDPEFPLVPWMDEIAVELIEQRQQEDIDTGCSYLLIELQRFDHPVKFVARKFALKETLKRQYLKKASVTQVDPTQESDLLELVQQKPFTWTLISDERILIWHQRERLVNSQRALMMFIKSVDWIDEEEVRIVEDLMEKWCYLEAQFVFEMLAMKQPLELAHRQMLWSRVIRPALLENMVQFKASLPQLVQVFLDLLGDSSSDFYPDMKSREALNFFVGFLVKLAGDDEAFSTKLFWYLRVSSREHQHRSPLVRDENYFAKLQGIFLGSLAQSGQHGAEMSEHFYQQVELFGKLESLMKAVKKQKGSRDQKQDACIEYLDDPSNGLMSFKPVPLPLNPSIMISGILADRSILFKSNALPLKLHFIATDKSAPEDLQIYPVIFKEGDDLRQDQLVLEIIDLIDRIWKRNKLDLRLTRYKVLATSVNTGLVQFIPSLPLSTILSENNGNLRAYLSSLSQPTTTDRMAKSEFDTLSIDPQIHDNYLRSSAGYSVITYILGVGDRHLENLLLSESGHLFHVDFTFVFGRDPKPFPPPMKLCKEMVEAMSGVPLKFDGQQQSYPMEYRKFKRLCFTGFTLLRRNARELITSIGLLSHSGTADLSPLATPSDLPTAPQHHSVELGPHVSRAVLFVQERLMMDLTEEEALARFDQLIDESVTALFPQVMETIHKWAQYWRT